MKKCLCLVVALIIAVSVLNPLDCQPVDRQEEHYRQELVRLNAAQVEAEGRGAGGAEVGDLVQQRRILVSAWQEYRAARGKSW